MKARTQARAALVLLWWGTVVASLHDGGAAGVALLQQGTPLSPGQALTVVHLGCAWDAAIGLALLLRPGCASYALAAAGTVLMTLLATAIAPALWLDPLGPLLKNLPVLALLQLLATKEAPA
jgi:hypothetical protein